MSNKFYLIEAIDKMKGGLKHHEFQAVLSLSDNSANGLNFKLFRAPTDGYYMFTLVIREPGNAHCAGSLMRTPASDPNNAVMLCRAEQADYAYQTGSCTVKIFQSLVDRRV